MLYYDAGKKSDPTELKELWRESMKVLDSTRIRGFSIVQLFIVEVAEEKYLIPSGMSDVYHWKNGHWNNLYKGSHHGFNYGCKVFVHKGDIYAFGGYGFWRRHGMLIKYLWDRAEWELMPYTGDLEFFYAWQTQTGLHAINNRRTMDIDIDHQKLLNQTASIDSIVMTAPLHWSTIEYENYYFIYEQLATIIDKRDGRVYIVKHLPYTGSLNSISGLTRIYGDSVTRYDNYTNNLFKSSVKDEMKLFKPLHSNIGAEHSRLYLISGAGMLSLMFGVLYYSRSRKQKRISVKDTLKTLEPWNNKFLEQLLLKSGETLDADELDTIFEIHEIVPAETQRFKRSNIIKEVNRLYCTRHDKDLIVRRPDPEDGRRFVYVIGSSGDRVIG